VRNRWDPQEAGSRSRVRPRQLVNRRVRGEVDSPPPSSTSSSEPLSFRRRPYPSWALPRTPLCYAFANGRTSYTPRLVGDGGAGFKTRIVTIFKRPLRPLIRRFPAARAFVADVRTMRRHLRTRRTTDAFGEMPPEQAFRSAYNIVLNREPTAQETGEVLPLIQQGLLPR